MTKKTYSVWWTELVEYSASVFADTEEEARKQFEDGELIPGSLRTNDSRDAQLLQVEEE